MRFLAVFLTVLIGTAFPWPTVGAAGARSE